MGAIKPFLDGLQVPYTPRVYSLNYDDILWRAAPGLFTGFGQAAGPNRFDSSAFFARRDEPALFYLHGSIHISFADPHAGDVGELFWFQDVAEAAKGSDYTGTGEGQADGTFVERSPLVTGLEKSASVLAAPFSFYFSELLRDLMTSDIILIVGYGLADAHVNALLKVARTSPRQPSLVVLDYFDWMDVFHNTSAKTLRFTGVLRSPIFDDLTTVPMSVSGWRTIKGHRAAIWNGGFKAFLATGTDIASIVADLT
jgi:hypothetical protein